VDNADSGKGVGKVGMNVGPGPEAHIFNKLEVHRMDEEDSEYPHEENLEDEYEQSFEQALQKGEEDDWGDDMYDYGSAMPPAKEAHENASFRGQNIAQAPVGGANQHLEQAVPADGSQEDAPQASSFGGIGEWIRDKLSAAPPSDAVGIEAQQARPEGRASHFPESDDDYEDSDDGDSSDMDAKSPLPSRTAGIDRARAVDRATFRLHFLFDPSAEKLEFEVAWKTQLADGEFMEPIVGNVDPGGQADRRGVEKGDNITECNTTPTEGKVRSALIPLLKRRPLLLKVDRTLQLVDRRNPCVELKLEITTPGGLGVKLLQNAAPPRIEAVKPDSVAENVGLVAGDVLVDIQGEVAPRDDTLLKQRLQERPLLLTIWRFPLGTTEPPNGFQVRGTLRDHSTRRSVQHPWFVTHKPRKLVAQVGMLVSPSCKRPRKDVAIGE
jgi:hypothetical protein